MSAAGTVSRIARPVAAAAPGRREGPWRSAAGVAAAALAIAAFYLATYAIHRFRVPIGWDAPGYAWRTHVGQAFGVANLPANVRNPGPANAGRPAFVVIASLLGSIARTDPQRVAMVLPAIMAASAGLATGVVVGAILGKPRGEALAIAVGVGTSVFLVQAINVEGYQDNVIGLAVLTVAATPVLLCLRDRRAVLPAVILLAAAATIHWNVFEIGAATIVLTAVAYGPWSVRRWGTGLAMLRDSPLGRLFQVLAGGLVVAAAYILGVLTAPIPSPRLDEAQFLWKIRRDLPRYHMPIPLAAAAGGAVALARGEAQSEDEALRSRAFLVFMLAWCEVTLLFFVAGWIFRRPVPTHRVLALCLALPILGGVGLLWVARRAGRWWTPLWAVTLVVGIGISAVAAQASWLQLRPVMNPELVAEASTAAAYLKQARVADETPVVFVMDNRDRFAWSNMWLAPQTIRAGLPAARVAPAYFYVGTPDSYLSKRPGTLPRQEATSPNRISKSRYDGLSATYFAAMSNTYRRPHVALILSTANPSFQEWVGRHPELLIAPGVAVVHGPLPRAKLEPVTPAEPVSVPELATLAVVALALMAWIGGGWTRLLLARWLEPWQLAAATPAVGTAVTVLGGVLLNRAGIPLRGMGAAAIVLLLGAGGWLAAWLGARGHRASRAPAGP